jgi:hypothetical protein
MNGAQPFITTFASPNYTLQYLSVHCQVPNQTYMNTWKVVETLSTTTSTPSTYTGNTITGNVFTIVPSMFGLSVFTSGTYYFEFRFIGQNCISKVCSSVNITIGAVTPTPTPTNTTTRTPNRTPTATSGLTLTPTPTPTATPSSLTTYTGCGRGATESATCFDTENNRTFYSNCNSLSFGIGCYVYVDTFPNPLTGYNFVQINGATWAINSVTGVITGLATEQC